jgi:formylglycine-generating enzyme required for sulfatase activity/serine/threonine protein kinase
MADDRPTPPAASSPGSDPDCTLRVDHPLPSLKSGQRVFGRYVLESVLGRGGMAVVWRARDETLSETVALKFLPEAVARDEAAVEELKDETKRARRLTHPNIVRIHDFVQDEMFAAVSMEFVDGDTLAKRRLEQPEKIFSVANLTPLVVQLCAALDYAHTSAKIVHHDLKPANLLVTREGQLKVADFGIARGLTEATSRLTGKASRTSGTLVYVSPQQLLGEAPSPADDIYSLGATLYELLTGKPPFFRGDAESLILQVREKTAPPLTERRAELEVTGELVPRAWEETILACLAKCANDRPQSAREVAKRLGLRDAKQETGAGDSTAAKTFGRNHRTLCLGAAVAAAAIAGAIFISSPSRQPATASMASVPATNESKPTPSAAREFVLTIDPAEADARASLGASVDVPVPVQNGRLALKDLPDGEQELTVKAAGYHPSATRVSVKDGRGAAEVRLIALRGTLQVKARPGSTITLIDGSGRETRAGIVGAERLLVVPNLATAGRYTLRADHPDCASAEKKAIEIAPDGIVQVAPEQIPHAGELRVFSVPQGANVSVDGKALGKTPATLSDLPSEQPLRLEIEIPGFRSTERTVTLRPKEVRTVNVGSLTATSSGIALLISAEHALMEKAQVKIDARDIRPIADGDTWRMDGLEPGTHTVELFHPDFQPWKQTIRVKDRETVEVKVNLVPKPATLTVVVTPTQDFTLLADGGEIATKDGKALIAASKPVVLELRAKGFSPAARTLTAKPNGIETWQVTLEKPPPPQSGQPWENTLGMKFVPVPGTQVLFSIWDTRVQDFEVFARASAYDAAAGMYSTGADGWKQRGNTWKNPGFAQGPTHPVGGVSWNDAQMFCAWLTKKEQTEGRLAGNQKYRLPSDAEWSIAIGLSAESGSTPPVKSGNIKAIYPWGTQWPPPSGAGNYSGDESRYNGKISGYNDGYARASPVGSFAANRHGLYDMGGNVWQWCDDVYDASNKTRVLRGNSFLGYSADALLSSSRSGRAAALRRFDIGFRCVLDLKSQKVASSPAAATPITAAQPSLGQPWTIPDLDLTLVAIPAGTFTMGSDKGASHEKPPTRVTLTRPFWLGKTEVRQRDWEALMSKNPSRFVGEDRPVDGVTWIEAMNFCRKLTERERAAERLPPGYAYTLPSAAQWEYACRAGTTGDYASDLDRAGWYAKNSENQTHPVAQKRANAWGLHDTHGNVWEWCADWSPEKLPGGSVRDYTGPSTGTSRIYCGGSWTNMAGNCRSASRSSMPPNDRHSWVGFRLALAPSL